MIARHDTGLKELTQKFVIALDLGSRELQERSYGIRRLLCLRQTAALPSACHAVMTESW